MNLRLETTSSWRGVGTIDLDRFPYVVGRLEDADCCLRLVFISRRHCSFSAQEGTIVLQDLESQNGTFLNGRRLTRPMPIQVGDFISLGPLEFQVGEMSEPGDTISDLAIEKTKPEIPSIELRKSSRRQGSGSYRFPTPV